MYLDTKTLNYYYRGSHVTYSPGGFFVVWSDLDAQLLTRPHIASKMQHARLRMVEAWTGLLFKSVHPEVSSAATPPDVVADLAAANAELRSVYVDAGLDAARIDLLMEVNRSLLVNALNNTSFALNRLDRPPAPPRPELFWPLRSERAPAGPVQR